jgi:AcrR family transcriptional regulator
MARGSLTKGGRRQVGKAKAVGGRNREQEILDAAVDIFHANGYSATSVDDVANSVGILKGSLYYYMDSKEDLLARIVEEVHEDVEEIIRVALARADLPPLERLAEYLRNQVDYNIRNIKRNRVYYHDYDQLSPPRLASVRKSRRSNEQSIIALVKEAKEAGEIPATMNERLATKNVFAPIIWMYTWYKPGGGVSGKELGDFCADFVVNGLRGPAAASGSKGSQKRDR